MSRLEILERKSEKYFILLQENELLKKVDLRTYHESTHSRRMQGLYEKIKNPIQAEIIIENEREST